MLEYIERDKVLAEEEFFGEHATWDNPMADGCMAVRSDFIMNMPAADVVPVRYGRWIEEDDSYCGFHTMDIVCSECNKISEFGKFSYCPNCGARMDGE